MSRRREEKGARKKGERRRWGRHVQRGFLVLGGGLALALVVFLVVLAGRGGEETEPFEGSVVEKGPGTPEPGSDVSGPSLHFPVTDIDFGHVPLDKHVSYSFEFVNAGDAPLTIEGTDVRMLEGC
jgi:hypothetical protein